MQDFIRVGKNIINLAHVVRTEAGPSGQLKVICSIGHDIELEGDEAAGFESALGTNAKKASDESIHHA